MFNNITKAIKDVSGREYRPVIFIATPCRLRTHIDRTLAGPKTWHAGARGEDEREVLMFPWRALTKECLTPLVFRIFFIGISLWLFLSAFRKWRWIQYLSNMGPESMWWGITCVCVCMYPCLAITNTLCRRTNTNMLHYWCCVDHVLCRTVLSPSPCILIKLRGKPQASLACSFMGI